MLCGKGGAGGADAWLASAPVLQVVRVLLVVRGCVGCGYGIGTAVKLSKRLTTVAVADADK